MLRQRPDHLFHIAGQPLADADALPALGQVAATKDRTLSALRALPIARRFVRRRHQHGAGISRQKNEIVKIIARKTILRALPATTGVAALEEPARAGNEK